MSEPTPAEIEAVKVLIAHTRTDIASCHCGWGSHAGHLGQSHALHVWRELQQVVLPDHDARVRADERQRVAAEIARAIDAAADAYNERIALIAGVPPRGRDGMVSHGIRRAARIARQHTTREDT